MRFLLDEDLHPEVAEIGRGLGYDIVSVHEIDRRGLSDREQLSFAAGEGRILVTRNRDDFIRLTVECFQASDPHAGVLIVPYSLPNHQPRRICEALSRWVESHEDLVEMELLIDFLSNQAAISALVESDVDLVLWEKAPESLRRRILEEGELL